MALTREKKEHVVGDIEKLLASSKLTVVARYQGTPVKAMQLLRNVAAADGTTVQVVKNRLFNKALSSNSELKAVDTSEFVGQLLYAFNSEDELAAARNLADFAKTNPQIEFVAGITPQGELLDVINVKELANLPTKDVLRAQLISAISAPITSLMNVVAGNVRGVLNVFNARAGTLGD